MDIRIKSNSTRALPNEKSEASMQLCQNFIEYYLNAFAYYGFIEENKKLRYRGKNAKK